MDMDYAHCISFSGMSRSISRIVPNRFNKKCSERTGQVTLRSLMLENNNRLQQFRLQSTAVNDVSPTNVHLESVYNNILILIYNM